MYLFMAIARMATRKLFRRRARNTKLLSCTGKGRQNLVQDMNITYPDSALLDVRD